MGYFSQPVVNGKASGAVCLTWASVVPHPTAEWRRSNVHLVRVSMFRDPSLVTNGSNVNRHAESFHTLVG